MLLFSPSNGLFENIGHYSFFFFPVSGLKCKTATVVFAFQMISQGGK